MWSWEGATYKGCAETPDWEGHDWCYVQGTKEQCVTAMDSTKEDEEKDYRECAPCNCMQRWNWQGNAYSGCTETPDWEGHEWCYAQGGENCFDSVASTLE